MPALKGPPTSSLFISAYVIPVMASCYQNVNNTRLQIFMLILARCHNDDELLKGDQVGSTCFSVSTFGC